MAGPSSASDVSVHLCGSAYYKCENIKNGARCQPELGRKCPSGRQFRESVLANARRTELSASRYLILSDVP